MSFESTKVALPEGHACSEKRQVYLDRFVVNPFHIFELPFERAHDPKSSNGGDFSIEDWESAMSEDIRFFWLTFFWLFLLTSHSLCRFKDEWTKAASQQVSRGYNACCSSSNYSYFYHGLLFCGFDGFVKTKAWKMANSQACVSARKKESFFRPLFGIIVCSSATLSKKKRWERMEWIIIDISNNRILVLFSGFYRKNVTSGQFCSIARTGHTG